MRCMDKQSKAFWKNSGYLGQSLVVDAENNIIVGAPSATAKNTYFNVGSLLKTRPVSGSEECSITMTTNNVPWYPKKKKDPADGIAEKYTGFSFINDGDTLHIPTFYLEIFQILCHWIENSLHVSWTKQK